MIGTLGDHLGGWYPLSPFTPTPRREERAGRRVSWHERARQEEAALRADLLRLALEDSRREEAEEARRRLLRERQPPPPSQAPRPAPPRYGFQPRPFRALADTGSRLWDGGTLDAPAVIDLAGAAVAAPVLELLFEHDPGRPVGEVTQVTVAGGRVTAAGWLRPLRLWGGYVFDAAAAGKAWQCSIGWGLDERSLEWHSSQDAPVLVNGRWVGEACYIARAAKIRELSVTDRPSDKGTWFTIE